MQISSFPLWYICMQTPAFIWLAGVPGALKKHWPFGNLCAPRGITHSDAYLGCV
jgi:hypothetical protein